MICVTTNFHYCIYPHLTSSFIDNARMLESRAFQTSDFWIPHAYVWRFQYNDSKSIHGIIKEQKTLQKASFLIKIVICAFCNQIRPKMSKKVSLKMLAICQKLCEVS